MKISTLEGLENYKTLQAIYDNDTIESGYTSDLLSDVMAHAEEGGVLITIQAHKNSVAVASLVGVVAIIICNSRPATDDMIESAKDEGIAIFQTPENQFQTSHRIAQLLSAE